MFTQCLPNMATFKTVIKRDKKKTDGTWNVLIRLTHHRKVSYLSTSIYVTRADITSSFKIKNQQIIDKCDDIIRTYRKIIMSLNLEVNDIELPDIVKYIKKSTQTNDAINFTQFFYNWCNLHKDLKGLINYKTAFRAFQKFMGVNEILHPSINVKTLQAFSNSLSDRPRAQSLYTSSIVKIFDDMRDYYNDEDNGIIRIKQSLRKFDVPKPPAPEKRALDVGTIRKIFALPYDDAQTSRRNLALDCFRLSFALMGMNSVDLYNATEYDGTTIAYERTKTKARRSDHARIEVVVHPIIKDLVEKYVDCDRVFNFHRRYSTEKDFNKALNIGLKQIGAEIGVERLQFYSARHSMATIAVNDVGISKYIVNDMLNHTDDALRVTELYIKKSFKAINDANFQLLDYVFNTTKK